MSNAVRARQRRRIAGALVAGVLVLSACGSDGLTLPGQGEDTAPEQTEPGNPEPEPTEPEPEPEPTEPEPEPPPPDSAPQEPPVEEPDDEDDGGLSIGLIILIAVIVLGVLGLLFSLLGAASRRGAAKSAADDAGRRQVGELVGLSRWLVDQGSVDVLRATERSQLDLAWQTTRSRAVDLENRCQAMAGGTRDPAVRGALTTLGIDVSSLRVALETNVSLRIDPNAANMQQLLQDSAQTVASQRQTVRAATDELARLIL